MILKTGELEIGMNPIGSRGPFSTPGTLPYNAAVARVGGLPERIDPPRLAEREGRLCGHLSLARMERLRASLCDGEGTVFIDMRFQRDEQGRDMAVGHVTARLPVRCQRCLEAMEIAIATAVRLAFTAIRCGGRDAAARRLRRRTARGRYDIALGSGRG